MTSPIFSPFTPLRAAGVCSSLPIHVSISLYTLRWTPLSILKKDMIPFEGFRGLSLNLEVQAQTDSNLVV